MGNLNRAMLIGRLTHDPQLRYTPSGQAVTTFSLATNRYAGGGDSERQELADFHNVVVWNRGERKLAEIVAEHLSKGRQVYVEGRLQTRSYTGQDGVERRITEVVASDVQFLERRRPEAEDPVVLATAAQIGEAAPAAAGQEG
jgi:single-strand DNA-binding protein